MNQENGTSAKAHIVVLKVGGSLGTQALTSLITAIRTARDQGMRPVVVHGGGPRITEALAKMNETLPFVEGQRRTPPHLMPIVERVLCDEVNGELCDALRAEGVGCHRMGRNTGVLFASPLPDMGRTGQITDVVVGPILECLARDEVPVLAPVGYERETGLACNVNADLAASAIAGAVAAQRIVFFTDVDGIYSNLEERELILHTTNEELATQLQSGMFEGGMRPKVTAVLESISSGAHAAFVIHGAKPQAAKWALSIDSEPDSGIGTCVVAMQKTASTSLGGGI